VGIDPATSGVLAQLGVGGALVVVVAYVMVHVFKLFINHWNKQETDRTEAYKVSAKAHADALMRVADTMDKMTSTLGDRVTTAFNGTSTALSAMAAALDNLRAAVARLEGKFDAVLDSHERTPVGVPIPVAPEERSRGEYRQPKRARTEPGADR